MANKIKVDSAGAGVGKSYQIRKQIKENLLKGIKSIVVVPSHKLQHEYVQTLAVSPAVISSEEDPIHPELARTTVGVQLEQAFFRDEAVIIMSHDAFLNRTVIQPHHRVNRQLIIDEAFKPVSLQQLDLVDSAGRQYFKFDNVFSWTDPEVYTLTKKPHGKIQPWFRLDVVKSTPPKWLRNTKEWRAISNPNARLWATWQTGQSLMVDYKDTATLIVEVNPCVFDHWQSVWIAAAAFEKTLMCAWMQSSQIEYTTYRQFKPHRAPLHLYTSDQEFNLSLGAKTHNSIWDELINDCVRTHATGPALFVDNKNFNGLVDQHFTSEKLSHNAHGINDKCHYHEFAWMSAIRPNDYLSSFLLGQYGLSGRSLMMSWSGYDCYQLLMRSALRDPLNKDPVRVYLMDTGLVYEILDLFDSRSYETYPIIEVSKHVAPKKIAMTSTERSRNKRAKAKI